MLDKFKSLGKRLPDPSKLAVETAYADRPVEDMTQREKELLGTDTSDLVGRENSTTIESDNK